MKEKKEKRSSSWQRPVLVALCALLAIALAVLLVAAALLNRYLGLINRVDPGTGSTLSSEQIASILNETDDPSGVTGEVVDPTDITWSTEPSTEPVEQGAHIINILLIGQDRRAGEYRSRSDAMILCTINTEKHTLTMTSFMRDLYVQIPGYSDNRINTCYQLGGMDLLDACLELNFGIKVDGNVEVDFNGFMEAIDIVGGLDIELTSAEANYLNRRGNWEVTEEAPWNLYAGLNHLTGSQALAYSRIRNIDVDGDFSRTKRQRKVLTALLEKSKSLSVSQIDQLLLKILPLITTDMSDSQIIGYASKLIPLRNNLEVISQRIPGDDGYRFATVKGMDVLIPDLEACRRLLSETLGD